jgi:hypothetical protein
MSTVGLMKTPYEFNPSILERHLLRQEDRILELQKIVKWLERRVAHSLDNQQLDGRALEASGYAHRRLTDLRSLQWQREEAGYISPQQLISLCPNWWRFKNVSCIKTCLEDRGILLSLIV